MLIPAFCRALLDPFAPARRAGALSLAATQAFHSAHDAARKVVPAVAPLAVDADSEVRRVALPRLSGPALARLGFPPSGHTGCAERGASTHNTALPSALSCAQVRRAALQCLQVYMAKLEGESRRLARREAGITEEGGPDGSEDALARAASVAQESVNESMTWVRAREPTKQYAQEGGKRGSRPWAVGGF